MQVPALAARTILIRSFSKSYGAAGWRIGFVHAGRPQIDAILAAHEHAITCVPSLLQRGALAMLRSPAVDAHVRRMVAAYAERRRIVVAGLNRIADVTCHAPEGAFNAFPDCSALPLDSRTLADRLLEEAGLLTIPGAAFGALGEGHLRVAFTQPPHRLTEALARMDAFCSRALARI